MTNVTRMVTAAILLAAVMARPTGAQGAKSPGLAATLSTVATLVPIAAGIWMVDRNSEIDRQGNSRFETGDEIGAGLIVAGAIIGPALGQFYAHDTGLFWYRLGIGAAAGTVALTAEDDAAIIALLAGGAAVGVLGAIDIIRTPKAVRCYNASRGLRITAFPGLVGGRAAMVLGVKGQF